MKLRVLWLAGACLVAVGCASTGSKTPYETAQQEGWNHYGWAPDDVGAYVALGALQGDEQNVVVKGVITETCSTSGCWIKIDDKKGHDIIVLTEESKFHLPRNCTGHRAVAHGNMEVREIPVEQRRHYAEVAGASPEEIAKITEPQRTLVLIAGSVFLEGEGFVDAYTVEEAEAACKAQLEKELSK
ncbi:MAG: DUF4920 domain-containing protein [Planctomycetota bacterium]|jgi:hypothetical protein